MIGVAGHAPSVHAALVAFRLPLPLPLSDVVSSVTGGIGQVFEIISDPFRWLYHHTLGAPLPQQPGDPGWAACQQDWTQAACPKVIDELRPQNLTLAQTWPRLYSGFAVSAIVIALTACVMRAVRATFDERVTGLHLVTDAVTRAVVAVGVLALPSPQSSLLLNALRLCAAASSTVAGGLASAVSAAFGGTADVGTAVTAIATTAFGSGVAGDFLVAIPVLLAALGFLYIVALFLVRVVQLVFAVASAPLFVAVAVYDTRSRFVQWWLDLFVSAMLLPPLLAFCGSLTGCVALFFLGGGSHPAAALVAGGGVVRSLLACFTLLGGVWMTGKAAHGLAWRSFTHGGFTGAVTALSTAVMAIPQATLDATHLLQRAGSAFGGGGPPADAGSEPAGTAGSAAVGRALAGRAAALSHPAPAVAAAMEAARAVDLARFGGAGQALDGPQSRLDFNGVVGAAIAGAVGEPGTSPVDAAATARSLADDPALASAVVNDTLASVLHGGVPDLAPLLGHAAAAAW